MTDKRTHLRILGRKWLISDIVGLLTWSGAAYVSAFLMWLVAAGGLFHAFWALRYLFALSDHAAFTNAVKYLLKGIELILIAPLPYLVLCSVNGLVTTLRSKVRALHADSVSLTSQDVSHVQDATIILQNVKQWIAGILVALLLTDLVGKLLSDEFVFSLIGLTAHLGATVVAIGYYVVVGMHSGPPQHEPKPSENRKAIGQSAGS